MKKALFILPLLFLTSCSSNSIYSNSNEISSSLERKTHKLFVFQVYSEVSSTNEVSWSRPRYDVMFQFYEDEEITLEHLKTSFSFYFTETGGYYIEEFVVYDYKNLDTKVPETFYLTQDTNIYYGYTGGVAVPPESSSSN